jgi:bacterioferritin-associated ferredoxin
VYICHCNALTDHDVRRAVEGGARRTSEIYRAVGCKAQCGRCVKTVVSLLWTVLAVPDGLEAMPATGD